MCLLDVLTSMDKQNTSTELSRADGARSLGDSLVWIDLAVQHRNEGLCMPTTRFGVCVGSYVFLCFFCVCMQTFRFPGYHAEGYPPAITPRARTSPPSYHATRTIMSLSRPPGLPHPPGISRSFTTRRTQAIRLHNADIILSVTVQRLSRCWLFPTPEISGPRAGGSKPLFIVGASAPPFTCKCARLLCHAEEPSYCTKSKEDQDYSHVFSAVFPTRTCSL